MQQRLTRLQLFKVRQFLARLDVRRDERSIDDADRQPAKWSFEQGWAYRSRRRFQPEDLDVLTWQNLG